MWSAILLHDGQAVTDPIPCDDYDAAGIAAPVFVALFGGPVSVGRAVVAARPSTDDLTLFEVA